MHQTAVAERRGLERAGSKSVAITSFVGERDALPVGGNEDVFMGRDVLDTVLCGSEYGRVIGVATGGPAMRSSGCVASRSATESFTSSGAAEQVKGALP